MEALGLLAQAPIVGVFAWYAWQNNKEWRKYLNDRNSKLERSLEKLADVLERHHDARS